MILVQCSNLKMIKYDSLYISSIILIIYKFLLNLTRTICVQYRRILFYSFGKQDFSKVLHKIIYVQIAFGYYFADNVGRATI